MINLRDICLKNYTQICFVGAWIWEKKRKPPSSQEWLDSLVSFEATETLSTGCTSTACTPQMVGWGDQNPNSEEERSLPCSRESSDFPLEDSGWNWTRVWAAGGAVWKSTGHLLWTMRTLEHGSAPKLSQWGRREHLWDAGTHAHSVQTQWGQGNDGDFRDTAGDTGMPPHEGRLCHLFDYYIERTRCICSVQSRKKKQGRFVFILIVTPVSQI